MSQTTNTFLGEGSDTTVFTPYTLSSNNAPRACIGINRKSPNTRWYGIYDSDKEKISPNDLSFCQYCGENAFNSNEVWLVNNQTFNNLVCDTPTKKCKAFIGERRCMALPFNYLENGEIQSGKLELNINLIDEKNDKWVPVTKGITKTQKEAEKVGALIVNIPTHQRWQFVVKPSPNYIYNGLYYKFGKIKSKDGREVKVKNHNNKTKFYIPISPNIGLTEVNGYETGIDGTQFFFIAPSNKEIYSGIEDKTNLKSNIFQGTITIHRKVMKDSNLYSGISKGGISKGGISKGGISKGGTNLSTDGFQENIRTTTINAEFPQISSLEFTIQLINNETDNELDYFADIIDKQIILWRDKKITKLLEEKNKIDLEIDRLMNRSNRSNRSKVIGENINSFNNQDIHLI